MVRKNNSSARLSRGKVRKHATFPVAPTRSELPYDYGNVLSEIKRRISEARLRSTMSVNAAMVLLYWDVGRLILGRQENEGWGAKVIDRLSVDLSKAYPDMKGFSPRNLLFMRAFAAAYADAQIVKQLVSLLPWGHIVKLLQKVKEPEMRNWYAKAAIQNGWSRSILALQIENEAHKRQGKALNNFKKTLPPNNSDMAEQIFKKKPIGVAGWETKIVKSLPKQLDGILPTIAEIEAEFKDEAKVLKRK